MMAYSLMGQTKNLPQPGRPQPAGGLNIPNQAPISTQPSTLTLPGQNPPSSMARNTFDRMLMNGGPMSVDDATNQPGMADRIAQRLQQNEQQFSQANQLGQQYGVDSAQQQSQALQSFRQQSNDGRFTGSFEDFMRQRFQGAERSRDPSQPQNVTATASSPFVTAERSAPRLPTQNTARRGPGLMATARSPFVTAEQSGGAAGFGVNPGNGQQQADPTPTRRSGTEAGGFGVNPGNGQQQGGPTPSGPSPAWLSDPSRVTNRTVQWIRQDAPNDPPRTEEEMRATQEQRQQAARSLGWGDGVATQPTRRSFGAGGFGPGNGETVQQQGGNGTFNGGGFGPGNGETVQPQGPRSDGINLGNTEFTGGGFQGGDGATVQPQRPPPNQQQQQGLDPYRFMEGLGINTGNIPGQTDDPRSLSGLRDLSTNYLNLLGDRDLSEFGGGNLGGNNIGPDGQWNMPEWLRNSAGRYGEADANAVTRGVGDGEFVENRLGRLMRSDNELNQIAQENALEQAAARGMLGSGVAAGAALRASREAMMPIAQQDAQTEFQTASQNMDAMNRDRLADQQNRTGLLSQEIGTAANLLDSASGRRWQSRENNTQNAFTLMNNELEGRRGMFENQQNRDFTRSEREGSQEFQGTERQRDREFTSREREAGQEFTRGERIGGQEFQGDQRQRDRDFTREEREGGQQFTAEERQRDRDFTRTERIDTQGFQTMDREDRQQFEQEESGRNRDLQRTLQEINNDNALTQQERAQRHDRTMGYYNQLFGREGMLATTMANIYGNTSLTPAQQREAAANARQVFNELWEDFNATLGQGIPDPFDDPYNEGGEGGDGEGGEGGEGG